MVPATEIARWKAFFAKIPAVATSTFSFEFPRTGILPVAFASSSSSAQLLCLPSGVSAERQRALLSARGIVSAEQAGPLVEPIPYPGYSAKERDRKVKAARGPDAVARGKRGRGRGRSGAAEANAADTADPLALLLVDAPDTELDMFYPTEIVRERFLCDSGAPQRQYEVTWNPSVTSKHKNATFQKSRVECIVKESSDGKHALVKWRNTWEKADAWDEDKVQAELVNVWREYCAEQDVKTPMSPPGSDKEEAEDFEDADESSESESEQEVEEEVGL